MGVYRNMTQENFPQNNEGVSLEEALSAISAVNSELIGFQASQEAFNKLSSLKDRLEEGVSPSIIMKEAEDLRDLAEQAHNSSESLDIAA